MTYRSGIQTLPQTYGDITVQGSCYTQGFARPVNTFNDKMYGQVDIYFVPEEND